MWVEQESCVEGGLALGGYCSRLGDELDCGEQQAGREAGVLLEVLAQIAKGWPSEWCLEANSLAIQVLGGYGYTRDFMVEQYWRDNRLNMIHEGTHGIQALDLLGRKVLLGSKGKCVRDFTRIMMHFARPQLFARGPLGKMARATMKRALEWNLLTLRIMLRAGKDRDLVGSSSVDYLMYSGYVMMGYFWALQAAKADKLLASGKGAESPEFYRAKIQTAEFYFDRLLPRADAHRKSALAPTRSLMQMGNGDFAFS